MWALNLIKIKQHTSVLFRNCKITIKKEGDFDRFLKSLVDHAFRSMRSWTLILKCGSKLDANFGWNDFDRKKDWDASRHGDQFHDIYILYNNFT